MSSKAHNKIKFDNIRAWSVLTETEEPTVLGRFFGTETEIEPMLAKFLEPEGNRNLTIEPWVPETSKMGVFGEL